MQPNPPHLDNPDIFDATHLTSQFTDDEALCEEIIRVMLEELPIHLKHLAHAVETRDVALAHRTVHSLKGAAANIGARELRQAAAQLETALAQGQLSDDTPALLMTVEQASERLRSLLEARGI